LKQTGRLHSRFLEFFRPNHGHEQIDEQQQRDDPDNDGFHCVLLKFLTEADVKAAHDKKQNDDSGEDEVVHRSSFGFSQKREYSRLTISRTVIPTKINSLINLLEL
jgi:hypothetical protein